jgi:hypothetical protein
MKNVIAIQPLTILRKSASGLAIQVCTAQQEAMLAVSNRGLPWVGVWLPLSQVVIKDRKVVGATAWVIKAKGLPKLPEGVVGVL